MYYLFYILLDALQYFWLEQKYPASLILQAIHFSLSATLDQEDEEEDMITVIN